MKAGLFDYPVPRNKELRSLYTTPYRFSKDLRDFIDYLFKHPYNNYRELYASTRKPWDANDMAKVLYLQVRYYLDHPQQFGGAMDNIAPHMLVSMWRSFIGLNKHYRKVEYSRYYKTDMKLLKLVRGRLFDLILAEIKDEKFYMTSDDMIKRRTGLGLKEKRVSKARQLKGSYVEYLCSLE